MPLATPVRQRQIRHRSYPSPSSVSGCGRREGLWGREDFQVTLEDQEDQIDGIKINGEAQKTNKRSRIYQFTVQDLKNYEIEVKASDYAGNQAVGHMQFQVSPKKTVFQRLMNLSQRHLAEMFRYLHQRKVMRVFRLSRIIKRESVTEFISTLWAVFRICCRSL